MLDGLIWIQLLVGTLIGVWIAANARDRNATTSTQIGLFIAGFLLSVIAIIGYFAFRPKKFGEKNERRNKR